MTLTDTVALFFEHYQKSHPVLTTQHDPQWPSPCEVGQAYDDADGNSVIAWQPVKRHLSEDDFAGGQSVDGLHFDWGIGKFHFDTLTYRHPDPSPDRVRGAVANWLGFSAEGPVSSWTADLMVVNDYLDLAARVTLGPFVRVDTGRFHLQTEAYVQGVLPDEPNATEEVNALFSQTLGYTVGEERLLRFRARYDVSSPDLSGGGQGFANPVGDSYRFFGHLGLFQTPAGSAGRGVSDLAGLVALNPHARLELELDAHQLWFLDDGAVAGQELDGTVRYHVSPYGRIELGLWTFLPSVASAQAFETIPTPTTQYIQFEIGAPPRL